MAEIKVLAHRLIRAAGWTAAGMAAIAAAYASGDAAYALGRFVGAG